MNLEKLLRIECDNSIYEIYTDWTYSNNKLELYVYKINNHKLEPMSEKELSSVDRFIINVKKEIFNKRFSKVGTTIHSKKIFQIIYDCLTRQSKFYEIDGQNVKKPTLTDYKYLNNKYNSLNQLQKDSFGSKNKQIISSVPKIIIISGLIATLGIQSITLYQKFENNFENYNLSSPTSVLSELNSLTNTNENYNEENLVISPEVVFPRDINSFSKEILSSLAKNPNLSIEEKNYLINNIYKLIEDNETRIDSITLEKSLLNLTISYKGPVQEKYNLNNSIRGIHQVDFNGQSNIIIFDSNYFDENNKQMLSTLRHELIHVICRGGKQYEGLTEELNEEYSNTTDINCYATLRYHDYMLADLIGKESLLDDQFGKTNNSIQEQLKNLEISDSEINEYFFNLNNEITTYTAINNAISTNDKQTYYEEINNMRELQSKLISFYKNVYELKGIDYNEDELFNYYNKFCEFFKTTDYFKDKNYVMPVVGIVSKQFTSSNDDEVKVYLNYYKCPNTLKKEIISCNEKKLNISFFKNEEGRNR